MTKPSKQVRQQPRPPQPQPREISRAEALRTVLMALDFAADAGAFKDVRPEVRQNIRACVEFLKAPEPPQPAPKPCPECDKKKKKG